METTGRIDGFGTSGLRGKGFVTLQIPPHTVRYLEELQDKDVDIKIVRHRKKRSLNANSYAWVLIRQIANKIQATEDEVYQQLLRDYGQSTMVKVQKDVPFKDFYKYCDEAGTFYDKRDNKYYTFYRCYKGSSEMNTQEMARLIDGIIEEAKRLGLQVLTPDELRIIKDEWSVD